MRAPLLALLLLGCGPGEIDLDPDTDTDADTAVDTDPADTDTEDTDTEDTDTTSEECPDSCDDGLACTVDTCDDRGRCFHDAVEVCEWPASLPPDVTALSDLDDDLGTSLSGATWNPYTRALWVVRGNGATAWRIVEDGAGGWSIEAEASLGRIDAESIVLADPAGSPTLVHVLVELEEVVTAFDLSGDGEELTTWDTSPWLRESGTAGSEGMTFVPDDALTEWGFTDEDGAPRTSALGYGGLFFVGTQNGGDIHVFDLSATSDDVDHVGSYATSRTDTSGLEFDAGTGRLYVWHGGDDNDLEIVRLSSGGGGFDTEAIFDFPGDGNIEGVALAGLEDCVGGVRDLFFTTDDGDERALDVYEDWPLCGP